MWLCEEEEEKSLVRNKNRMCSIMCMYMYMYMRRLPSSILQVHMQEMNKKLDKNIVVYNNGVVTSSVFQQECAQQYIFFWSHQVMANPCSSNPNTKKNQIMNGASNQPGGFLLVYSSILASLLALKRIKTIFSLRLLAQIKRWAQINCVHKKNKITGYIRLRQLKWIASNIIEHVLVVLEYHDHRILLNAVLEELSSKLGET